MSNPYLKLAFVNPWSGKTIGPNIGMRQLAEESLRRGHEVHIFAPTADDIKIDSPHLKTHSIPDLGVNIRFKNPFSLINYLYNSFRISKRLTQRLQDIKADLLCINSENMLFMPRAAHKAGIPAIVIVRGARFSELGIASRVFFKLQQRWVDKYIGVSQIVVNRLLSLKIPEWKCDKIYNGVNCDVFKPTPKDIALMKELGLDEHHLVIGTVCHLVPRKGVHHLIQAMAKLVPNYPELKCVIVGGVLNSNLKEENKYVENLSHLAKKHEIEDNIIWAGPRTDVANIYNCLDIVIHPSETESFGRTIAEAMACGKPVVGFDIEAVGELIDNDQTGYLAQPFADDELVACIQLLLDNPSKREFLGQIGRHKAITYFDLKKNIELSINCLEQTINTQP